VQLAKIVAAACAVVLAARAHAQTATHEVAARFEIAGSVSSETRVNENASPARYSGQGIGAHAGFTRAGNASVLMLSATGTLAHLRAPAGLGADAGNVDVRAGWLRPIGVGGLALGVAATVNGAIDTHRYAVPDERTMQYVFGWGGVGPAALWRGWRSSSVLLTAPVAGIVAQSYSALRSDVGHSALTFSVPRMGALRSASAVVTSPSLFGARLEYRLDALNYRAAPGVRSFSQSIGLSVGLGARR